MRRLLGRLEWPERTALALLALWVTWTCVAAPLLAGRMPSLASPYLLSPVVLVVGVVLGRLVATRVQAEVVTAGLVVATTFLLLAVTMTDGPAKGPLGYANANAALAVQVMGLCGLAMLGSPGWQRVVLALTTVAGIAVIGANASKAAFIVAVPLVAAIAVMVWRPARRARWAVLVGAATLVAGSVTVLHLAGREQWPTRVAVALDPARQSLWSDAISVWSTHPIRGAGPGSLADLSTLGSDPDTASAHSSILQVGAETGWVGLALFALLVAGGLMWSARGRAPQAVVAVAAWTALVAHSFTDHLLEFVPVVIAAGITVGWAAATRSEELDVPEGEGPGRR